MATKRKPKRPATLGQAIRLAREAKDLTQRKLAAESRITPVYMCRIEHDDSLPSLPVLRRIAARLGTTAGELLAGEKAETRPAT